MARHDVDEVGRRFEHAYVIAGRDEMIEVDERRVTAAERLLANPPSAVMPVRGNDVESRPARRPRCFIGFAQGMPLRVRASEGHRGTRSRGCSGSREDRGPRRSCDRGRRRAASFVRRSRRHRSAEHGARRGSRRSASSPTPVGRDQDGDGRIGLCKSVEPGARARPCTVGTAGRRGIRGSCSRSASFGGGFAQLPALSPGQATSAHQWGAV